MSGFGNLPGAEVADALNAPMALSLVYLRRYYHAGMHVQPPDEE